MMGQPNVLLLTIDTLRADMLGCYGHPGGLTPNLDRLAARALRFEQAISGGSWTQAAFPPLLTSTHAASFGGCVGPLAAERPSPVEAFAQAGYPCAAFVSSPLLGRAYGYQRGFTHFDELPSHERDPCLAGVRGGRWLLRQPATHHLARLLGRTWRHPRLYASAEALNERLFAWAQQATAPFFAWVHYMDVHWPYHREELLSEPHEIARCWRDVAHLHAVNWQGAPISAAQRAHYLHLYEEALRYTDAQVGALLDWLDEAGLAENTLIVVVSDHGEEFLERGHWGHWESNLADEIVRVPLLLALPSGPAGRAIPQQGRALDLMPTLLDLCGVPPPEGLAGQSLRPLWEFGGQGYVEPVAISEMLRGDWHRIAARTRQHKLIWDSRVPDAPCLYDLRADPGERQDVGDAQPDVRARLLAAVQAHQAQLRGESPSPAVPPPQLDDMVLARLRGLGYVE